MKSIVLALCLTSASFPLMAQELTGENTSQEAFYVGHYDREITGAAYVDLAINHPALLLEVKRILAKDGKITYAQHNELMKREMNSLKR